MTSRAWIFCGLLLLVPAAAPAKQPPMEILGVRLGMGEDDVHRRLLKVGSPDSSQTEESEMDQLWKLRDRRWASLLVHFDPAGRVEWVTAYDREGGRYLRYSASMDTS